MHPRLVVDRYEIFEVIAKGGMGSVHFGRLQGAVGFGRIVAIKRMHPQLVHDAAMAHAFVDEARLASRIQHPNVVPVLDVVQREEELLLVMEYVRGESLAGLLRTHKIEGKPPSVPVAAAVVAQALHGLHAAHEARDASGNQLEMVHRDVSPQNVFVGADGLARLLDFGVAKATQRTQHTREGQIKGKPSYMAPEQLDGRASRQSDVYAAGVVLWEAVTGARLFDGFNDYEVMMKVVMNEVSPPSLVRPDLPPALDAIVMRALARDPAARFPTARDMALAIESALDVAAPAEVGEWVQCKAQGAIAARDALVARIEATPPANEKGDEPVPSGPQERRGRLPALALVPLALLILLGLGWRLSTQPGASSSTPGPAAPLPRPSAAPSPSPSPTTLSQPEPSAPLASSSAAPSSAPSTRRPFPSSRPKPVAPDFL